MATKNLFFHSNSVGGANDISCDNNIIVKINGFHVKAGNVFCVGGIGRFVATVVN